jgi:TM2 domain-containing membrane protein YozV
MFCKNCGHEHDNLAVVCMNCGVAVGTGNNFCPNCGIQSVPGACVCPHCGIALVQTQIAGEQKSKIIAGILGILLGSLGVHNFYLGYTGKAVAQLLITLLTCGAGATITGIWGLIEGILILTGSIDKDANNIPLKD